MLGLVAGPVEAVDPRHEPIVPRAPYVQRAPLWHPAYPAARAFAGCWHAPCYPFASCGAWLECRLIERRIQRAAELSRPPPRPPPPAALPLGPPGPESELRPEYRDSGKLLPEFETSGQLRREVIEKHARDRVRQRQGSSD